MEKEILTLHGHEERTMSLLAKVEKIAYPILLFKLPNEDISSVVTEIVGNKDPDLEIEKKGSGILVIRVGTTEKSALLGHVARKGK